MLSFLAVVVATGLALLVFQDEFTGSAQAARMYVPQTRVAQAQPSGRLIPPVPSLEISNQSTAIDNLKTASVEAEPEANLSCNVESCSQTYRSFRASDCSFQPFEGPRRQCTR